LVAMQTEKCKNCGFFLFNRLAQAGGGGAYYMFS
jgi:hypothetical protein